MTGLAVVLPVVLAEFAERDAADRRDAVVALLPVDDAMGIAELLEGLVREQRFDRLDLLQAEHVGRLLDKEALDLSDAQADRIDVPGGDRDHGAGFRSVGKRRQWWWRGVTGQRKTLVPGAMGRGFL